MEDEVGELCVILIVHCPADPICLLLCLFSLRLAKQEPDKWQRRIDTDRTGITILFWLSSEKQEHNKWRRHIGAGGIEPNERWFGGLTEVKNHVPFLILSVLIFNEKFTFISLHVQHGKECGAHIGNSQNNKATQVGSLIFFLFLIVVVLFSNYKKYSAVFYTSGRCGHGRSEEQIIVTDLEPGASPRIR